MKTILVDARNTFVTEKGIFLEMEELLDTFSNTKIIVTNANDEQMKTFGLIDMPYEIFTLKHNPDKIDPVYFETLLKQYQLTANEVIYFEHNIDAVTSAESLGIVSFHYDKDKKDIKSLKEFLEKNI
ncbi:hypothetical protein P148_SR1C00001G0631 [candidate division SR1 bacterium RAAC1_SR1_1]|nr:hypothetical protein P148_SR1C00001G0631 [candidate division SR1 bacterium RAAC1_SR1_1]